MSAQSTSIGRAYRDAGYVIVPDLIGPERARALKAEAKSVLDDVRREMAAQGDDPDKRLRSGVYVGLAVRSRIFADFAREPRVLDLLEEMIGPNLAFFSDKIVFKDHTTDFGSPWHQDWAYWKGSNKHSIWIALDEATPENGCLMLVPGSHTAVAEHERVVGSETGFSNRLNPEQIDQSRIVTASLPPGGAVFFHDLTLHSSHANTSGRDRWALISTYRDAMADDPPYPFAKAAAVVRGTGRA